MPAPIDIAKVARLARLALTPEEMERYGAQLGAILEHAASIQAVATEGVLPTAHPLPMLNALRPDEVEETLDREEVLAQAPDREGPYFRVPALHGGSVTGDPADLTIAAAGAALRSGELSAAALLAAVRRRAAATEAQLHAYLTLDTAGAERAAAAADAAFAPGQDPGPLAGIPVAVKDNMCTRGVETTCGSRILAGYHPPYDATVVARLRAGRGGDRGQDQHGRVRHGVVHRELGLRPHPQPLGPGAGAGRVVAAGRRRWWRPARPWGRWAPTPGAPSASRQRCAGWWGSSPPTAW